MTFKTPQLPSSRPLAGYKGYKKSFLYGGFLACLFYGGLVPHANAQEKRDTAPLPRYYTPSPNLMGTLGLNNAPSARMDEAGTVRAGLSTSDPYVHGFIGFQLTDALYLNVRNSAQISSLSNALDNKSQEVFPALDVKLRLFKETATRPAIAIGMDSAIGHKRLSSEYVVATKRFNNFDITGGVAWGRMAGGGGTQGHITNPLSRFSSHFDKGRNYNSLSPQDSNNWFTGKDVSFFGGVEYYTPLEGLSVKADYTAIDYEGARAQIKDFKKPAPWSLSLNYKPWEQADFSLGMMGTDKVMARLSVQDKIFNWKLNNAPKRPRPALKGERPVLPDTYADDIHLLNLRSTRPTAQQITTRAVNAANQSDKARETVRVKMRHKGLDGPTLTLMRGDLEQAILNQRRSPEEIWHNMDIAPADSKEDEGRSTLRDIYTNTKNHNLNFRFIHDNKISISNPYSGILYRSSLLAEVEKEWPFGIITGGRARLNLKDNLHKLKDFQLPLLLNNAARADEDQFAERRFAIDTLYAAWLRKISPDIYISTAGGYLDEMFAGYGGEILYRPFGKRYALGAESWRVYKRDAHSTLNREFFDDAVQTAHLNLYYEVPQTTFTAYAKLGRYLREDFGGTLGLKNTFDNGTSLEGYLTLTDTAISDFIGSRTYLNGGIKLNIPLGNIPFVPDGSATRLKVGPIATGTGEILDNPINLYEATEPISYRQLQRSWSSLLE